uniref:Uncharacterized protein n=1 Tax=Arundo donax TaxID=35708 RepID=A0A0A9HI21_ARUDO
MKFSDIRWILGSPYPDPISDQGIRYPTPYPGKKSQISEITLFDGYLNPFGQADSGNYPAHFHPYIPGNINIL